MSPPPKRRTVPLVAVAAALFAGTVLLYLPAVRYGFSNYDDPRYVTGNAFVQQGFTSASVQWAFTGNADYWHPLTWLSHMLDWQLYGNQAAGHHFTSILWHAVNAVLVLIVLRRLTGSFWASAFTAAVFAWHPLRVESVVWITERKDVMSGCCFLLTLWAYTTYAERRAHRAPAMGWYAITLACFALGLMCKPSLVTAPLVLLALDFWPLRREERPVARPAEPTSARSRPSAAGLIIEKIPFFLLSAGVALATVRMQREVGAFTLSLPWSARLANVPVALVRYLGKLVWPTRLTVAYPHPGWWPTSVVLGATVAVVVLTIVAWRGRSRRPWLLAGWAWMGALLLPVIGLLQVGFQAIADRYTYLSLLGAQMAILWTVREFLIDPLRRRAAAVASAAILGALALATIRQESTWRDPVTMFEHAVAVTDRNSMAEAFLGYSLTGAGRWPEAILHSERALALDPRNEMAAYTLAQAYTQQGRWDDAIVQYRRSLELRPDDPTTQYELAVVLVVRGDIDSAKHLLAAARQRAPSLPEVNLRTAADHLRHGRWGPAAACYEVATLLEPTRGDAHFGLGQALIQLGRDDDGRAALDRALALNPDFAPAHVELGALQLRHSDFADAFTEFQTARRLAPQLLPAMVGLGRAAESLGDHRAADEAFAAALAAAPTDPDVNLGWAEVLARRGQFAGAVACYRTALLARPHDASLHAALGFALYLGGERGAGVAEWKEALRLNPSFPGLRARVTQAENSESR